MTAAPRPKTEDQPVEAGSSGIAAGAGSGASAGAGAGAGASAGAGAGRAELAASEAAAAEAEGWALLDGLRRRMDEHANQNRKTQTEVRQLAESIGALVTEQRRRSRWLNLNSFVAYLMFTLLCSGAFYLLYQSRAHELVGQRDRRTTERDTAVRRADEAITKTAARDAADAKALEVYTLLQSGNRDAAAKKLAELSNAPLSKLDRTILETRAKEAEVLQVDSALKAAVASFKAGHYADVVTPLEAALPLEPTGPRAALMHYYLGVAYAKASSFELSITHLQAAIAADVDVEDVRFHLASVLDRAGQWGKAKVEYDRFATAHPMSSFAAFAMRRGATLGRLPPIAPHKVAPAPAAPKVGPAPKSGAAPKPGPGAAPKPGVPGTAPKPGAAPKLGALKHASPKAGAATATPATASPDPDTTAIGPKPAVPAPGAAAESATTPATATTTEPPQQAQPAPAPKTIDFNDPSGE